MTVALAFEGDDGARAMKTQVQKHESDGVREVSERQATGETRAVRALGRIRRCHELGRRAAVQPSAAP